MSGYERCKKSYQELKVQYDMAHDQLIKDDMKDEDGDGVKVYRIHTHTRCIYSQSDKPDVYIADLTPRNPVQDVNQLGTDQLVKRKIKVALKTCDPEVCGRRKKTC